MMKENLIQFFDKFEQDFTSFDGAFIASRYYTPYTAISSDKSVLLYKEQKDIEQYFSAILADYKKQGVAYCTYSNFEFSAIGQKSALATMDWNMKKADGTLVTSWRESYLLILGNETLKIVTSIDH
jgi:hypothetical protein